MPSRIARPIVFCVAAAAGAVLCGCTVQPRYSIEEGRPVGEGVTQIQPRYSIEGGPPPPPYARPIPQAQPSTYSAPARDADAPRIAPSGSVDSRSLAPTGERPAYSLPAPAVVAPTQPALSPSPYAQGASRPPVLGSPSRITVGAGESVFDIAERYRIPVRALIEANGLQPPYTLTPGATLTIPPPLIYRVQQGDTLFSVARRFNVDPRSLASLNDIAMESALTRGQAIAVPFLAQDQGAGPQAAGASPAGSALGRASASAGLRGETYPKPAAAVAPPVSRPRATRLQSKTAEDAQQAVADAAGRGRADTAVVSGSASDAQVSAAGRGRFVLPLKGELIATFGAKGLGQRNDGVNIAAAQGTPVKAAAAGEVVYAGSAIPGFGNLVLIKHAGGWVTAYAHLDTILVKMRGAVLQGIPIGTVGQSGGVDQPQLHFEIRYPPEADASAKPIDPGLLLPTLR